MFNLVKGLQNYKAAKLAVKKNSRPFGFEATFFAILYSESLLFGRSGFDSRQLQTLRAHNFVALEPTGSKTTFFERSNPWLLGKRKKIGFAGLLRVLLIGQSTIKLYHKKQIDPERLTLTVFWAHHHHHSKIYNLGPIAMKFSLSLRLPMYQ